MCLIVGNPFKKINNILVEEKIMPNKILLKLNTNCEPNIDSLRKDKWGTEIPICCKYAVSDAQNPHTVLNTKLQCFPKLKLKFKYRFIFVLSEA